MTEAKDTLIRQQHDFIEMALMPRIATDMPTLRDQFAMAALTGFMGSGDCATGNHDATARLAYRFADAMLEARKEKK